MQRVESEFMIGYLYDCERSRLIQRRRGLVFWDDFIIYRPVPLPTMGQSKPNVLVLMSDQHNFRFNGYRDNQSTVPVQTPTLDSLADNSTVFDRTYCSTPLCTPSRLSLLTGLESRNAGAWELESMLKPGLPTIPSRFSDAGYNTALIGKMHLGGNRQFAGFDHRPYGDLTGQASHQLEQQSPDPLTVDLQSFVTDAGELGIPESLLQEQNVIQESMSFLRDHRHQNPNQPWFLCASFSRPHWPRTAPKRHLDRYPPEDIPRPRVGPGESDTDQHPMVTARRELIGSDEITDQEMMRARGAYFACVNYLDEMLSDFLGLLQANGFLKDTIVVYLSDHGELAGERGLWEKSTWHEASTRVPLLFQLPEHRTGEVSPTSVSKPVSLIDVFPTLCELAELAPPEALDGVSLAETVHTGEAPDRKPVFVDSFVPYREGLEYRMVVDEQYKYVKFRNAPELFFDLDADPLETQNLAENASDSAREAHLDLKRMADETVDFAAAEQERERDRRLKQEFRLGISKGTSNQYHWPDGSIVDSDTPIYHPYELAAEPDVVFSDFPDNEAANSNND